MIQSTDADNLLAAARLRGQAVRRQVLAAEGGTLAIDDVAALLHSAPSAVEELRRQGRILALPTDTGTYCYPRWQFDHDRLLPGFDTVLGDLQAHDCWMQALFFLNGNEYIDGATPLAALRRGELDHVRRAARTYGEQGAA
jgi:hypothetical protein